MKQLELGNCIIHEMNDVEMVKINGGSELSESILRGIGFVTHKVVNAIEAVDWNRFYSHAFQYN